MRGRQYCYMEILRSDSTTSMRGGGIPHEDAIPIKDESMSPHLKQVLMLPYLTGLNNIYPKLFPTLVANSCGL